MSTTPTIVYVYTGARWSDFPARQCMLTRALSRYCRMIYLECGAPSARARLFPWAENISPEVTIVRDAMRLRHSRLGKRSRWLAAWVDGQRLSQLLGLLGAKDYLYWVSTNDPMLLVGMQTDRLVYDCIDPCFDPRFQAQADHRERQIAARSKHVFATAEALVERMKTMHDSVTLLPNGGPDTPFREQAAERPVSLKGRHGRVVGYMGTLDWRFDPGAVMAAAEVLPHVTFCLVGRVNAEQAAAVSLLKKRNNVIVTGAVSVAEGKAYMAAFDVGLIPFVPGAMNDAINPCKMYMYLWAGMPVVATDIRECRRHAPHVLTADENSPLVKRIEEALSEPQANRERRRLFAAENSWDQRARQAMSVLGRKRSFAQERRIVRRRVRGIR